MLILLAGTPVHILSVDKMFTLLRSGSSPQSIRAVAATAAATLSTFVAVGTSSTKLMATSAASSQKSFYDLSAVTSDGSIQSMADFQGKVVYATNVASQ
jgi:hypothetical protein